MIARDLNEIDRHIADTRRHIERQRATIKKLSQNGHAAAAVQAQGFLKTLEGSLSVLLERRSTILRGLGRSLPGWAGSQREQSQRKPVRKS
jgi:hypothetical protein